MQLTESLARSCMPEGATLPKSWREDLRVVSYKGRFQHRHSDKQCFYKVKRVETVNGMAGLYAEWALPMKVCTDDSLEDWELVSLITY